MAPIEISSPVQTDDGVIHRAVIVSGRARPVCAWRSRLRVIDFGETVSFKALPNCLLCLGDDNEGFVAL